MNLATFRARISGAIGLSNIASSTEQGLIDGWVNEGVVDFLRRTKMHTRLASMALTAGQYSYELDTDILAMKDLWIDPSSGTSALLEPKNASDILYMRTLVSSPAFPTMYYSLEGANMLLLHPAPSSSADTLHILYVPRPAAMSVTADTPSATANGGIPAEFHPALESYAKWKAAEHADRQDAQKFQQDYQIGVIEAMKSTTTKAGVRLSGIKWGKRNQSVIPSTPGTDVG